MDRRKMKVPDRKFESDSLNEAYFDRNQAAMLAAVLAFEVGYPAGWVENADDPDWPILMLELPTGQVSWHIPKEEIVEMGLGEPWAACWDGHDLTEKRKRIADYLEGW